MRASKQRLALVAAFIVVSTVAATSAGGWAVVTVEDVPDYLVVGKAVTLDFVVRQHGHTLMTGLKPEIEARDGLRKVVGRAWETPGDGRYRAVFTVAEPGEWRVTIRSGFGRSKAVLLPIPARTSAASAPEISSAERGRRLFAAKGCVTCHVRDGVDVEGEAQMAALQLTGLRYPAEYLASFLADPSSKPGARNKRVYERMPNLDLRKNEIASLVAFINSDSRVANR